MEVDTTVECENNHHEYIIAEMHTGFTRYVCKRCGKEKWEDSFALNDAEVSGECAANACIDSEYVILDPEKTRFLFSDTLELYMCQSGETVRIQKTQVKVGRDQVCDLRLEDGNVSGNHATFLYENQYWFLRDNQTTNGTYINGNKLQPSKKYMLFVNDRIGFAGKNAEVVFYRMAQENDSTEKEDAQAVAILEAAMKNYSKSNSSDVPSHNLIVAALKKAPLYFPVEEDTNAALSIPNPIKLKNGAVIHPPKDIKMKICTRRMDDGSEIISVFTSKEKAKGYQSTSTIRQYPLDYLPTLLQMNKPAVINPFDEARFVITPDFLENVLAPQISKNYTASVVQNTGRQQAPTNNGHGCLVNRVINGEYHILKQLNRASAVEVYLAMNVHLNRVCVVKACRNSEKNLLARDFIINEAFTMMELNHPAIPKIYDIAEDESYTYVVREYIQGDALDETIRKHGAQPVNQVVDWAKQVCEILRYLHSLNPPHIYRDMKPANILLQPDGKIRLIDFHAMRLYDEKKDYDTTPLGTRGFAAPEQYGGAGQTDCRTDIFGLGMTMHNLLTGVNPIDPPYITQPIRKINPKLPVQLEKIIQKCIEPDRAKRYQNVDSLLRALNKEAVTGRKKGLISRLFGKP